MRIDIKFGGTQAVQRKLRTVGSAPRQRAILRKAVREAGKPVLQAMRANAPVRTGVLRLSLTMKVPASRRATTAVNVIGARSERRVVEVRRDRGRGRLRKLSRRATAERLQLSALGATAAPKVVNPANYAHLVELGTRHAPAQPFALPALRANRNRVIKIMREVMWREIERAMSG